MYVAQDGSNGQGNGRTGHRGKDVVIDVPSGTIVFNVEKDGTRRMMSDLAGSTLAVTVAAGGGGGRGNSKFASSKNRAPMLAEAGEVVEEMTLYLELKLLADVGVVGMPSVGKSSLLRMCSRARPEVAAYPFTTLEPVLGFVEGRRREFIIVEIPGLIEGAHQGVGLGDEFLKHMERTRVFIHLLDGSSESIVEDYRQLRGEMRLFNEELLEKPEVVVVNKIDLPDVHENLDAIREGLRQGGIDSHYMSAATGEGVEDVLDRVASILATQPLTPGGPAQPIPIVQATSRGERPSVTREGEVFVLKSPRAERLVRRVDLEDWNVQVQLWAAFERMGIVRVLERAGARTGATVRIGEQELEWK
jgi:GTP-binding protein